MEFKKNFKYMIIGVIVLLVIAMVTAGDTVITNSGLTADTVDTGQGANELYDMDQNVLTSSTPTFAGGTFNGNLDMNHNDILNWVNANRLQEGLVGYWGFEHNSGTTAYDSSREENDGTLHNGPAWVAGKDGTALDFDGTDDYIKLESDGVISNNSGTISFWVKRNEDDYYAILGVGNEGIRRLVFLGDGGDLYLESDTNNNVCRGTPTATVTDWNFYAVSIQNGTCIFYENSIELESSDDTIDDKLTFNEIGIEDDAHAFNGSIDNIRVYNRTLSTDEIRALYHGFGNAPTGHLSMK